MEVSFQMDRLLYTIIDKVFHTWLLPKKAHFYGHFAFWISAQHLTILDEKNVVL